MNHYGYLLRILNCGLSQRMTAALAQMELTSAQGHLIGFLAHCDAPPCPRDVEEHFQLSHPTVSGLLTRLEKKGFLELRPDPDDRRCKRIHLLPKGWECDGQIRQVIQENENLLVQGFSPEEQNQLFRLLTRAARNMNCEPHFHFEEDENS